MSPARIDCRVRPCCMCGADGTVSSSTTPDPEAPELIQLPPGAWAGFIQSDHVAEMVVICSDVCRLRLLVQ